MEPSNQNQNSFSINEALLSIALAIQNAFGSGALRLAKATKTSTVLIATTATDLFGNVAITLPATRTIRIYIHAGNIIGSTPASDRIRVDILVDGVVVGRVYSGTANVSGRFIECEVAIAAGSHTITASAIKDVGTGTVSFYADGSGTTAYLVAENAN